ncbi:DNA repair protein RecO [Lactobacillus terrae]|uniref:DNA repair protein RecO n=1 Tax=Lactobacillus terrae TaxID=2269374 RepID=UPI000C1B6520|nr:DNA repair protein RecO [Lactobacillus terrae]
MNKNNSSFFGIITRRAKYQDSSAILTVLTKDYGFKSILARGVQKPNSKLSGAVIPFTYADYSGLIKEDGFSYINSAINVKQFENIINDIELSSYATFIFDLTRSAFFDEPLGIDWYTKIFKTISLINKGYDPQIVTNLIQIQIFEIFGVEPNVNSCVIGNETEGPFDFSTVHGGIICHKHFDDDPNRLHIPSNIVELIRKLSTTSLDNISDIHVKESEKLLLQHAIDSIHVDLVGEFPKSKKYLDDLKKWNI